VNAPAVAVLIIVCTIYYPADLAPVQGSGAHEAGFYRDIDGGFGEVFAAQEIKGGSEGDDLSVGGAVVESLCLVVSAGDDLIVQDDDGADGDLFFRVGFGGFF
jgi:hypothetical protein